MSERFEAGTQYDDLKGSSAFDGHSGTPLFELAERSNMPGEYFPVGFELFRLHPDETGKIPFNLLAVRVAETGATMDDISSYANSMHEFRVYRFDGKLEPDDFEVLFKRIDIKALSKALPANKVEIFRPGDG